MARPTNYTEEQADLICEKIATSNFSMKSICEQLDIPVGTVLAWLHREPTFQEKYARAKEMQADLLAEEILDIADDGSNDFMTIVKGDQEYEVENKEFVNRSRLRVDSRKWIASKLKPKKYGDRITQEITGANGGPLQITGITVT
jgi:CRISPR/Cas system-associated endonuclease Cas3-HD